MLCRDRVGWNHGASWFSWSAFEFRVWFLRHQFHNPCRCSSCCYPETSSELYGTSKHCCSIYYLIFKVFIIKLLSIARVDRVCMLQRACWPNYYAQIRHLQQSNVHRQEVQEKIVAFSVEIESQAGREKVQVHFLNPSQICKIRGTHSQDLNLLPRLSRNPLHQHPELRRPREQVGILNNIWKTQMSNVVRNLCIVY